MEIKLNTVEVRRTLHTNRQSGVMKHAGNRGCIGSWIDAWSYSLRGCDALHRSLLVTRDVRVRACDAELFHGILQGYARHADSS